jgi:hypothetical protein
MVFAYAPLLLHGPAASLSTGSLLIVFAVMVVGVFDGRCVLICSR